MVVGVQLYTGLLILDYYLLRHLYFDKTACDFIRFIGLCFSVLSIGVLVVTLSSPRYAK
ncbi:hypothetical protein BGX38DRAFT_1169360 [Terfezia claveryi]|nr:hypothetical protein BGX38DRAFT_1169360 [Terfezia claveryi]